MIAKNCDEQDLDTDGVGLDLGKVNTGKGLKLTRSRLK
jgi:hypothetical protein